MIGLEPILPFGNNILSVARLPLRHIPIRAPIKNTARGNTSNQRFGQGLNLHAHRYDEQGL